MKKNIFKLTANLLLTASLTLSSVSAPVRAANTEPLSQFDTITREYTGDSGTIKHYHYIDGNGNIVNTDSTSATKRKAANLPSSYDLRTLGATTSIKNQGVSGSCWAFSALKSMESSLLLKNPDTMRDIDLSENHLSWYTYHPSTDKSDPVYGEGAVFDGLFSKITDAYSEGGSSILAAFTLARWSGAVNEAVAPFDASTKETMLSMANTMNKKNAALHYSSDYKLTDAICYDDATTDEVKQAIMENGAMSVALYYNSRYNHTAPDNTLCYYENFITRDKADASANHCVTIIGWDDNYSRQNFGSSQPSKDGAWLIANSYGTEFGQDGYFWISYEEPSLTEYYTFSAVTADTYDNNYQYDGYGWGNAVRDSSSDATIAANIFTANRNYTQSVKAVGLYTVTDNQPYTIKVYRSVTAGRPDSGTLAATVSGTIAFQGYHTVSLPEAVSLNAGEHFSIVLSYSTGGNNGYMPLEGKSVYEPDNSICYTSNAGESYLYALNNNSRQWIDLSTDGHGNITNNVCIKAFTTNEAPAAAENKTITLSRSSLTLGKGETFSARASVKNASDTAITWESSRPSIASVNDSGKITALSVGTTTITASLPSGQYAELSLTVKKAPDSCTVSPKSKTLKKKKKFQIRVTLPKNSASYKLTYTSSKPKVAKVNSSGKVTALKKGAAVITVKTFNKKTAQIKITVKN